jgi:hypothetical protein
MIFLSNLKEFLQTPKFGFMSTRDEDLTCDIVRTLGVQILGPNQLRLFVHTKTPFRRLKIWMPMDLWHCH